MPAVSHHKAGSPCWVDLMTSDLERAQAFYGDLFGWSFEAQDDAQYGGYVFAKRGDAMVAGLMAQRPDSQAPDAWTIYLRVDSLDTAVRLVTQHGGTTVVAPMEVPGQGRMAIIQDPAGAVVGLWETIGHPGFQVAAEAGAGLWFETLTRDYRRAARFYQEALGWELSTMSDTEEFRYGTFGEGDDATAGIMDADSFLPPGVPSLWQWHIGADDVDAAVARVPELGGTVIRPLEDTPFGRLGTIADPTGAVFCISST